jgi:hypothetical protein
MRTTEQPTLRPPTVIRRPPQEPRLRLPPPAAPLLRPPLPLPSCWSNQAALRKPVGPVAAAAAAAAAAARLPLALVCLAAVPAAALRPLGAAAAPSLN